MFIVSRQRHPEGDRHMVGGAIAPLPARPRPAEHHPFTRSNVFTRSVTQARCESRGRATTNQRPWNGLEDTGKIPGLLRLVVGRGCTKKEDSYLGEQEALRQIKGYAQANRLQFTRHALTEMRNAGAEEQDVRRALHQAHGCRVGNQPGRWKVTGPDLEGDDLDVVVKIEDGLLIITVM